MSKLLVLLGVVAVAMFAAASTALARAGMSVSHSQHGRNVRSHHGDRNTRGASGNRRGSGNQRSSGNRGGSDSQSGHGDRGDSGDRHPFVCNGTYTKIWVQDLVVPQSGVCLITNSDIEGSVSVPYGGDFEAGTTSIGGDVNATRAQTVYIYAGSTVGGDIDTSATAQTQIFDSTVNGGIQVQRGTDQVYVCNNSVDEGVSVTQSGPDILVGDHQNPDCLGNVIDSGNIFVANNATYVELDVGDNSVQNGDIVVVNNGGTSVGTSGESVEGNQGGQGLVCDGNAAPFVGSSNPAWWYYGGQCTA